MGLWKKTIAASFSLLLLFLLLAPVGAAAAEPLQADTSTNSDRAEATAAWLKSYLPGAETGREQAVIALLRGGYETRYETTIASCLSEWTIAWPAGAAHENLAGAGWQALALMSAGIDVANGAPGLVSALSDVDALKAEGDEAVRMALLVFGRAGLSLPTGKQNAFLAMANAMAESQNPDGSFTLPGHNGPRATALVVQALSGWTSLTDTTVDAALMRALSYLSGQVAPGGVMENGAASPWATAETILALSCLGGNPGALAGVSLPDTLPAYQRSDGSFGTGPDGTPLFDLTALVSLALTANTLYEQGQGAVYAIYSPAGNVLEAPGPANTGNPILDALIDLVTQLFAGVSGFRLAPPGPVVVFIIVGATLLCVVVAAILYNRPGGPSHKQKRRLFG